GTRAACLPTRRCDMEVELAIGESIRLGDAGTLTLLGIQGDLILLGLEEPGEERPKDDEEEERKMMRRRWEGAERPLRPLEDVGWGSRSAKGFADGNTAAGFIDLWGDSGAAVLRRGRAPDVDAHRVRHPAPSAEPAELGGGRLGPDRELPRHGPPGS